MVSQPDSNPSHSLVRGAQSVVSARTSSRPHNEFPVFSHSGDVEIVIRAGGRENRYLLHRHTLTRCSGFFEASTSQEWSKASVLPLLPEAAPPTRELSRIGEDSGVSVSFGGSGTGSGRSSAEVARPRASSPGGSRKRWRYELDPGAGPDDIPMLVQKEADSSSSRALPPPPSNSIFGGGGGGASVGARDAIANTSSSRHKHTQIFYNYPPVMDGINIADAYVQCKSLLTLADQYDALAVCGPRVDHHLLQFQSRLWKQVAKYPVSYLRLGYLSRSKIIFQEALIHVVGQWPAGERSIRSAFPEVVLDIIEDKVDELEETIARIEGRLFRLNLTNSRGERVTPSTSYLDWLAVSFFRQWLADNTSPPLRRRHLRRRPTVAAAITTTTAAALVTMAQVAPQHRAPLLRRTPRRHRRRSPRWAGRTAPSARRAAPPHAGPLQPRQSAPVRKRVDELKSAARELVRPLMGTGLELELSNTGSGGKMATVQEGRQRAVW
ncbi:hypothetical protein PG997_001081 [Apiospora hydei]|uniref:BTB domain-containing protein n=1 Tax=Apiospora hydei TaxID=1337664 RepID=A0ABR1XCN7_9PEZI